MAKKKATVKVDVQETVDEIQRVYRFFKEATKAKVEETNKRIRMVANYFGYYAGLPEKERKAIGDKARKHIETVLAVEKKRREKGLPGFPELEMADLICSSSQTVAAYERLQAGYAKTLEKLAKPLPVADWVAKPDQRGFGLLQFAKIIGECGNLSNYPNPAKVWRRMGCAPFEKNGTVLMGSTWRMGLEGKLTAAEWEAFGYSPRRRSVSYLIGEGLMKQNKGPYRQRFEEAKQRYLDTHESPISKTTGEPRTGRAHLHGMLLATKLLLKNLWIEWNK